MMGTSIAIKRGSSTNQGGDVSVISIGKLLRSPRIILHIIYIRNQDYFRFKVLTIWLITLVSLL